MHLLTNIGHCSLLLLFLGPSWSIAQYDRILDSSSLGELHGREASNDNSAPNAAPTATINAGVVVGTTTSLPAATATVNQFLGIPFAQSPPERFSPPQAPSQFSEPINATQWKPACIQQFQYPLQSQQFTKLVFNNPPPQESEDCLYLNVYAPSTPAAENGRAVLFWIYGGSLQFGNAGQATYDGSSFAAYEDVVVVTVNYRTNVFGFPNSPELPVTGNNLGFLDQRFALDWVQQNIQAFGGDPSKVTIFGESAGAFSVDALLTSFPKDSTPPFRAAILESGQYSYRQPPDNSSVLSWNNLTSQLGCPGNYGSNLTCVWAANATTIKSIIEQSILDFNPVADNVTLVSQPAVQRLSGNIARIPVLGGTNSQEGRVFVVGQNNVTAYLSGLLGAVGASLIPTIEAAYPIGSNGLNSSYDVIAAIFTDFIFQCPQALWANATASIGTPTWRYYFNASFTNTQRYPGLGAYHASEIPLVFGTYPQQNATTQEYALSQTIQSAWARFAKNPEGGPGWNQIGTGAPGYILSGASEQITGGVYKDANATAIPGTWDIGVLGDVDNVKGSGVTVLPQAQLDYRCSLWRPIFEAFVGANGLPPSN